MNMLHIVKTSNNPVAKDLAHAIWTIGSLVEPLKRQCGGIRLNGLPDRLKSAHAELEDILLTLVKAGDDDRAGADSRDIPKLIGECGRRDLAIGQEMARKVKAFKNVQTRYDEKIKGLRGNFTQEQIDRIIGETETPDADAHNAELAALKKEQGAIGKFMRDSPRYDQHLLIGTQLENWKP